MGERVGERGQCWCQAMGKGEKRAEGAEQVKLTQFQCILSNVNNARWAVSHGCCSHSFLTDSVTQQYSIGGCVCLYGRVCAGVYACTGVCLLSEDLTFKLR